MAECDSTKNTQYPTVTGADYYGAAQTDSFRCAINGSTDLSAEELRNRAELAPPSLDNRWYLRLGGNAAAQGIANVKNKSYGSAIDYSVSNSDSKNASNNFEMGLGYVWKEFALDLEWIAIQSITYTTDLIGLSPTYSLTSKVSGDTLLINMYWFFQDLYNVKLYGLFVGGYTQNRASTTVTGGTAPGTAVLINKYAPSLGLGFGGRFNIVSKLYADMAARYLILGSVKMQGTNGIELKANRTWLGASLRILWLW